jgi:hypothetical protein
LLPTVNSEGIICVDPLPTADWTTW